MNQIITLTRKDITLLLLDKTSVMVAFALPLVLVALVGSAFGSAFPPSIGITSYDYAFSKVMFWGLIGTVASSVASVAVEKSSGTVVRLQLAPIREYHLLIGKALACSSLVLVSAFATWIFATTLFSIMTSNILSLVAMVIATSVMLAGMMTFLSNFARTERAAGALSWGVMQVLACFSGIMFPTTIMPGWMVTVTKFNPLTWAVQGMEVALWKGGALNDMMLPLVVTTGSGVVLFFIGLMLFRWEGER